MLTDRQIFQYIGFDTDAMEQYKYSPSNAVLTPHLNCEIGLNGYVVRPVRGATKKRRSAITDLVEKDICRKWALRQTEILNNSISNAVLGG